MSSEPFKTRDRVRSLQRQAGYGTGTLTAVLAVLSLAALALWLVKATAPVSGEVLDYRSGDPVAGAVITVTRRGWGRSDGHGQVIWDKAYQARVETDARGRFDVRLPGPPWLVGLGAGSLVAEAEGFQTLRGIWTQPGESMLLQTVRLHETHVPGGTARLGWYVDGTPFGWSFIEQRALTDLDVVDIYPETVTLSPLRVALVVPDGGGLHFVSAETQGIATPSTHYLLRYLDEPPEQPKQTRIELDATPGTLFVRTTRDRYAKLAWDPKRIASNSGMMPGLQRPPEQVLSLPYVYRPHPGTFLPGGERVTPVDSRLAAVAAQLPPEGRMPVMPRNYRLELRDERGAVLERLETRLIPNEPVNLAGCPRAGRPGLRYDNLMHHYTDAGLPQISLRVRGERFSSSFTPNLVGLATETHFSFNAFDDELRPEKRVLVVREVETIADELLQCDDTPDVVRASPTREETSAEQNG